MVEANRIEEVHEPMNPLSERRRTERGPLARRPSRRRLSALLLLVGLLLPACVDTAEPTGPVPAPEGEEGELTSSVVEDAGAEAVGRSQSRTRSVAPR